MAGSADGDPPGGEDGDSAGSGTVSPCAPLQVVAPAAREARSSREVGKARRRSFPATASGGERFLAMATVTAVETPSSRMARASCTALRQTARSSREASALPARAANPRPARPANPRRSQAARTLPLSPLARAISASRREAMAAEENRALSEARIASLSLQLDERLLLRAADARLSGFNGFRGLLRAAQRQLAAAPRPRLRRRLLCRRRRGGPCSAEGAADTGGFMASIAMLQQRMAEEKTVNRGRGKNA
uniref:Uncharacterized protein n=1 Tax=Oryza glumipatula TaxID=40148 RepID=A0A0E0B7C9_9ORYZ